MAATNFTPIQLYFSTTASAVPLAANLAQGELAINITDGKLYYEDNAGVVQVIATKGAGTIGGSNTQIQYNNAGALAGNAAMTFNSATSTTTLTTLNLTNALGATFGGTAQSSYTQGDILYSSATNTLSKLGIGTVNFILTSTGSVPQWVAPTSITVQTANNLAGGLAGSVPYQSAVDTTTFLAIGAANRVMTSTGSAPQWVTSLTGLTGVSSSSITNTSLTSGRVVFSGASGVQTDSANLTFNGTTLSATGFSTTGLSTLVQTVTIGNSNFSGAAVFAPTTPAKLYIGTGTVTDTTSAIGATNATGAISSLAITPIAASNTSVTYTNASTLYIAGAPSAGTNITITNPYALYVNAGTAYFADNVGIGTSSPSAKLDIGSGNLNFSSTAQRITGDFTNATIANRVLFQTSTTNSATALGAIPNGTGTTASFGVFNTSDPANTSLLNLIATSTEVGLRNAITGTGTYLPMTFYAGGSERVRIDTSGNVGIGTSSPGTKLQAVGIIKSGATGTNGEFNLARTSDGLSVGKISLTESTQILDYNNLLGSGVHTFTINTAERMRIDSSGNVGIGTSTPAVKLDVNGITGWQGGTTGIAGSIVGASSGINNGGNLRVLANTTQAANVGGALTLGGYYTSTTLSVDFGAILGAKENSTGGDAAGYLAFGTRPAGGNMTERMRITSSGSVGIGTFGPTCTLDVVSDSAAFSLTSRGRSLDEIGIVRFMNNAGSTEYARLDSRPGDFRVQTTANNPLLFLTNSTERMRIDSSGNLLVGATGTANGKVHISGSVVYTVPATFSASIGANADWATGYGSQAINLSLWASSGIGGVSVYNVSDRRLKEQISPLTGLQALSFIEKAKPVQFVWKEEQTTDTGFIAQDILAAGFGHLVSAIPDNAVHEETDENGNVSPAGSRFVMKYDSVIPILTAAIQEQQAIITALTTRITTLETK